MYSQAHILTLMQKNDKDPNLKLVTMQECQNIKAFLHSRFL